MSDPASWALTFGATIPGTWRMVAVLDARPDPAPPKLLEFPAASHGRRLATDLQDFARQQAGRPWNAFGVTPLMIYRALSSHSDARSDS
jgi:hypothetical protein